MMSLLTTRILAQTRQSIIRTKSSYRALSHSKYIVKSPIEDVELPKKGNFISDFLFKDINKWSNKEALICSVSGQRYSYSELWDAISRFGGLLKKLGIKKGDTVALLAPNFPTYAIPFLGSILIGATVSPISSTATPDEILRQLVNCVASIVVSHPLLEAPLIQALESYTATVPLLILGSSASPRAIDILKALQDTNIPFADPEDLTGDEIAVLPYSSGTTGPPKGVAQTHHSFAAFHHLITHPYFFSSSSEEAHQDQYMGLMPFYHIYGMSIMLQALVKGMRIVTAPKFDQNTYVKILEDYKLERVHLVPTMLSFIVNSPFATAEALRHIKVFIVTSAPVSPTLALAIKQKLDRDILFQEAYGMTECFVTHQTPILAEKTGTAGQLLPNVTCKVVDTNTGEALPANERGEICLKTPGIMQGYYNNPDATAETIDNEGWLHTGDIGIYDDEGYFKIVDRTKELIKVKGLQVSPSEVEDVLRSHPKVVDVGVTAVDNERSGEAPYAFIVASESLQADEIHQFLKSRLAPHKQLTGGITMVESLPKSPTGKILRRELRKMAQTI